VRHGHLPEREIMTGIGPVAVRAPRVRDRVGTGEERMLSHAAPLLSASPAEPSGLLSRVDLLSEHGEDGVMWRPGTLKC
jgi:hypothetical protein